MGVARRENGRKRALRRGNSAQGGGVMCAGGGWTTGQTPAQAFETPKLPVKPGVGAGAQGAAPWVSVTEWAGG